MKKAYLKGSDLEFCLIQESPRRKGSGNTSLVLKAANVCGWFLHTKATVNGKSLRD